MLPQKKTTPSWRRVGEVLGNSRLLFYSIEGCFIFSRCNPYFRFTTTEYRHDCETVPTPNAQRQAAPPATASPLGKAKAAKPTGISLYPNPNTGSFTLTLSPGQSGLLEVATLEGRTVWQEWVKGNQTINPQPALSKGFYLCKISSSGKTLFVGKMVVQ